MLSLLWLIAVTLLVVTWQVSVLAQAILLSIAAAYLWFSSRYHHCQIELRPDTVYLQSQRLHPQDTMPVSLLYQTPYWLVVKVQYQHLPIKWRLSWLLNRYQLIYKDQFTQAEYRMIKSRLCVQQFMTEATQKSESEALK